MNTSPRTTTANTTAIITTAAVVGGHDGRAEIEVEITYPNGGVSTIALDEEACTASLDAAGVASIDDLIGQPWTVVLPALEHSRHTAHISTRGTTCSISSSATD